MERDIPSVVAEVTKCFLEYERALVEGDLSLMAGLFDQVPELVRFGVADRERGSKELARWRAAQPPLPSGRSLSETTVQCFGTDFAVVSTIFTYPERPFEGRQSQTWVRGEDGWQIVHAHVSEVSIDLVCSEGA